MAGLASGAEGARRPEPGIGMFCDEGGSTTIAAAVAVLVALTLVFGLANVQWTASRGADVQAVADAGALAGMNAVSSYVTIAQVLDALVLSMGLIGLATMAVGLVLSAIPVVDAAGPPVLAAASKVFSARTKLSQSCARGLQRLEGALPYAVAANGFLTVRANATPQGSYVGVAVPYPLEGASDFGELLEDGVEQTASDAVGSGERVDELSKQAALAEEAAKDALERAWEADCGGEVSMRERAFALAGLSGSLNPAYPSSAGWTFDVAIRRGRAYYEARLAQEAPEGGGVEEQVRSAARRAFYEYALSQLQASSFVQTAEGAVVCDLRPLPSNVAQTRDSGLYGERRWPCTVEGGRPTIHAFARCPGASGPSWGNGSVAQADAGELAVCPVCSFDVTDLGRVAAASTPIDNGFEHYWRIVVEESQIYQACKDEALSKLEEAKREGERSVDLFRQALEGLAATRVELCPPGRYGCICLAADPSAHPAPSALAVLGAPVAEVPARVAISAAALAPDGGSSGNNVLADFFDGLVSQGGVLGGVSGVLDAVMTVWGNVLVAYGNGYDALAAAMQNSFASLAGWGFGGVADWLKTALAQVVDLTGLKPADMSVKRPVLANSADVLNAAGPGWSDTIRTMIVAMGETDSTIGLQALLVELGAGMVWVDEDGFVVVEVEIPGTGVTIPVRIDLSWLREAA